MMSDTDDDDSKMLVTVDNKKYDSSVSNYIQPFHKNLFEMTADTNEKVRNTKITKAVDNIIEFFNTNPNHIAIITYFKTVVFNSQFNDEFILRKSSKVDKLTLKSQLINVPPDFPLNGGEKNILENEIMGLKSSLFLKEEQLKYIKLRQEIDMLSHIDNYIKEYKRYSK